MAGRENRQDSYARAARAAQLRATGATWERIAASENYPTARAAMKAAERHRQRNPLGTVDGLRFDAQNGYEITKATLFAVMADARKRHDTTNTIAAARAINDTIDKQCKLLGLHAPQRAEVDVTVTQTPAALIDRFEAELLAMVAQQPQPQLTTAPILEAEVLP